MRTVKGIGVHLRDSGGVRAAAGKEGHESWRRPVRDAGENLRLDIGLDGLYGLRIERGLGGQKGPKVTWLDGGDDTMRGYIVIVVGD